MRHVHVLLCLTLAAPAASFAAGPGKDTDPVAASFARLLAPNPPRIVTTPPVSDRTADPLYRAINVVLWQGQPGTCAFAAVNLAKK